MEALLEWRKADSLDQNPFENENDVGKETH